MIGKIARHSKYFQFSIVQWISNGKQWKYFHIHVISNKSEESEVDNSSLWIQPLDLGKDLDPGYQVVSKTQTARCPMCEVILPRCGLVRDYLSGPKGADHSAEDYSHDSIFILTPSLFLFGWYACRGVKIRFQYFYSHLACVGMSSGEVIQFCTS